MLIELKQSDSWKFRVFLFEFDRPFLNLRVFPILTSGYTRLHLMPFKMCGTCTLFTLVQIKYILNCHFVSKFKEESMRSA